MLMFFTAMARFPGSNAITRSMRRNGYLCGRIFIISSIVNTVSQLLGCDNSEAGVQFEVAVSSALALDASMAVARHFVGVRGGRVEMRGDWRRLLIVVKGAVMKAGVILSELQKF